MVDLAEPWMASESQCPFCPALFFLTVINISRQCDAEVFLAK